MDLKPAYNYESIFLLFYLWFYSQDMHFTEQISTDNLNPRICLYGRILPKKQQQTIPLLELRYVSK